MSETGAGELVSAADRADRTHDRRRRRRGIVVGIVILVALAVFAGWVLSRALLARAELERALPVAASLRPSITSGDTAAVRNGLDELRERAARAAEYTTDPLYTIAVGIPLAGPNLGALREISGTVDDLARNGVAPLIDASASFDLDALAPVGGRIPIDQLAATAPSLVRADDAFAAASERAAAIDARSVVEPVRAAVERLDDALGDAAAIVHSASVSARLLPPMLGADGDRRYILLFQNNAELRATGGIPGALALLHTSDGRLDLERMTVARDFPQYAEPVLPLEPDEQSVFGANLGRFMQDVTYTPDFPRAGELAAQMWSDRFGEEVDGVVAVDPVALAGLLAYTGPITLSTGEQLSSTTAVDFLLSGIYAAYPDPDAQDAVFADAASRFFAAVTSGAGNPSQLVAAVSAASEERRILVWNRMDEEQALLRGTDFDGSFPTAQESIDQVGVFFNDATAAKMDYYLDSAVQVDVRCEADRGSTITVDMASTAPPGGDGLSAYVTGSGVDGLAVGSFRTNVLITIPSEASVLSVERDGEPVASQVERLGGRSVVQLVVDLAPGESTTIEVSASSDRGPAATELRVTPTVQGTDQSISPSCPN